MVKYLGKRIKIARIKAGLSQGELARKLGIAYPTLSKYEQGHRTPDSVLLGQIAKILECDPGWLLAVEGERKAGYSPVTVTLPVVRIPVLNKVSSDFPEHVSDKIVEYISLPDVPKGAYAFIVRGDSMSPMVRDGDYVVFIAHADINNGDMVLVNNEWGESLLKRYHKKGQEVFLVSENPEYATIKFNRRYKIIGKVIVAWRKIGI
ncbi:MAG: helix-turn-helix domain-containing protein [Nitrospirae bacterium]|nr:helix-turn-helix domain-containing protein [Nitrospirota bacterium]